jgi:hypothetical protein
MASITKAEIRINQQLLEDLKYSLSIIDGLIKEFDYFGPNQELMDLIFRGENLIEKYNYNKKEAYHCELYDFGRKENPCKRQCEGCNAMIPALPLPPKARIIVEGKKPQTLRERLK